MKLPKGVLAVLLALAASAEAQVVSATITGSVKDKSGGAIPQAAVTVRNTGTGAAREASTNELGLFSFPLLPAGRYELTAKKAGFKSTLVSNIELLIDQTAGFDLELEVGEVSQSVTVEASAAALQTENATTGQVIEQKPVAELPLNGRNFLQLATLSAGVVPATAGSSESSRYGRSGIAVHVAGSRGSFNSYLLDGVENRGARFGEASILPSPDAIQEFKIQRSTFSAEYGSSPGIINVQIKSGSNRFHGSAYNFLRNNKFDARSFFDRGTKPDFRLNQFGFSFGGPLVKNQTFFFGAYEGRRQVRAEQGFAALPDPRQLTGDFSGAAVIRDPFNNNQPFPGNRIPADRISAVARGFNAYIPAPNTTGQGNLNYTERPKSDDDFDQFHVRVDHNFSPRDNFFARYSQSDWTLNTVLVLPGRGDTNPLNAKSAVVQETHIFSPTTINTVKLGFNRAFAATGLLPEEQNLSAALGFRNLSVSPIDYGLPRMSIAGFTAMGHSAQAFLHITNLYTIGDTLSLVRGRHTLTLGGDVRHYRSPQQTTNQVNPRFTFQARFTGNALADYLLGAHTQVLARLAFLLTDTRYTGYAGFVQDDFKVSSKLTLNLGVRYEYNSPWRNLDGSEGFLDVTRAGGTLRLARPTSQFGLSNFNPPFPVEIGNVRPGVYAKDFTDIAPRFGFAYQLRPSTVLRGGYGIFYAMPQGNDNAPLTLNPGANFDVQLVNAPGVRPRLMDTLFDPRAAVAVGGGQAFTQVDPSRRSPYMQQWTFNVQQRLPAGFVLETGYAGSKGAKLIGREDLNAARLQRPGETTTLQQRRPYPNLAGITSFFSGENSTYHSLTMRLERRFANGFSVLNNYTWSHAIDTWSSAVDDLLTLHHIPGNRNAERASSSFDIRHRWVTSALYELPFGKGKPFLSSAPPALNYLVDGWQINGILQLQTGYPFSILVQGDQSNTGFLGTQRPNRLGDGILPAGRQTPERWFDTSAYVLNPLNTYGNAGRNTVRGDGTRNVDLSLFKNNYFLERRFNLQFRAEFFNAFNNVNFGRPGQVVNGANFGVIQTAGRGREIQFALRFVF